MFRILIGQCIEAVTGEHYPVLLDATAPDWLLAILRDWFGMDRDRIAFFEPDRERIQLRRALLPGRVLRDDYFTRSPTIWWGTC